jgi:hypothetical protein
MAIQRPATVFVESGLGRVDDVIRLGMDGSAVLSSILMKVIFARSPLRGDQLPIGVPVMGFLSSIQNKLRKLGVKVDAIRLEGSAATTCTSPSDIPNFVSASLDFIFAFIVLFF